MRLARLEDASGEMRKFRDDLLAFKQRAAEDARAKQQTKADDAAARLAELKAVTVIEDSEKLGKLKKDALRVQLDVRRELLKEPVLAAMKLKEVNRDRHRSRKYGVRYGVYGVPYPYRMDQHGLLYGYGRQPSVQPVRP
ncbi:hypothetical protein C8R47DRAFT_1073054 [Mycena vitilis]|nr:hypothetical protein C8R47DRAFT_1073054 [Mycena vitilis]